MNNAVKVFENVEQVTMTSLELVDFINEFRRKQAEAAGQDFPSKEYPELRHDNFMAKVPEVLGAVAALNFKDSYHPDPNGRKYPCYRFPKREACLMAMSYSYELQAAVYDRMTALEQRQAMFSLPQSYSEALRALADSSEQNEQLTEQNEMLALENKEKDKMIDELKSKGDYVDWVLSFKGTVTTTAVASDYGMSAMAFNRLLHELRVQYNVDKVWILYAAYKDKGYMHSKTIYIEHNSGLKTLEVSNQWTQKGRLFLYELLKSHGILPKIEREPEAV